MNAMLNVFSPIDPAARGEQRAAYREFLADRDGVPDIERRTLSHREESMSRFMRSLVPERQLDRALFDAQYRAFDPRRRTPLELVLLITLVKVNAAEAFGVNRTCQQALDRARRLLSLHS